MRHVFAQHPRHGFGECLKLQHRHCCTLAFWQMPHGELEPVQSHIVPRFFSVVPTKTAKPPTFPSFQHNSPVQCNICYVTNLERGMLTLGHLMALHNLHPWFTWAFLATMGLDPKIQWDHRRLCSIRSRPRQSPSSASGRNASSRVSSVWPR